MAERPPSATDDGPVTPRALAVLAVLPEAVIVTDARGRVTMWNPAAEQLFGWQAEDTVGRSWLELGVALSASAEAHDLARTVLHGKMWEGSVSITGLHGRTTLVRLRAVPLFETDPGISNGASEVSGIVVTASDLLGTRYAQERTAAHIALLSRAGMLLGTSLDTGRTLSAIAELLVPSFADHCVVDLIDDMHVLRRAVTVHADDPLPTHRRHDPADDEPAADLSDTYSPYGPYGSRDDDRGVPITYPADHPCAKALASGRPVLVSGKRPYDDGSADSNTADARLLLADAHAVIAVPLLGPSGAKGVLAIAAADGQRDYDASDVELIEELAARAGLALENATLYDRKRSLAYTLQTSLLPADPLPTVDGLSIAVGYHPGEDLEVGGDMYDVVPLSAGRVGIVIGDVQGRGAHASAVMGQLRAAVRAYAVLDLEPATLLSHLDELVRGLDDMLLVTVVYAIYDPFTRRCILANAGHPPPLLAGADGCFPMEVPPDVPLGVGGISFTDHVFVMPPGDTMVLYTDGVVERRDQPVDQGVRALCAALERLPRDPHVVCRATLRAAAGPADDDQAVLAMRTSEHDLPVGLFVLPGRPEAASEARAHTRRTLAAWKLTELTDVAELLVSELVTNAVRHATMPRPTALVYEDDDAFESFLDSFLDVVGDNALESDSDDDDEATVPIRVPHTPDATQHVEVTLRRGRHALWIEVYDPDVRLPRLRVADETDEGGRGLYLVDNLSARWGARPTRTGKLVWFELPIDSPQGR
jgi:PAS domain S-box-containing protein